MKYVKILGLVIVGASALMALAPTASATTLTSPTGTAFTSSFTLESHSPFKLEGSIFPTVECGRSHFEGSITSHGSAQTVNAHIYTLMYYNCNYPVTLKKSGTLEIHAVGCGANKYCTGTVTWSGLEFTVETYYGKCTFATKNTHVGTLIPTDHTGGHATLDIGTARLTLAGGGLICGPYGTLSGGYTVMDPSALWIDA